MLENIKDSELRRAITLLEKVIGVYLIEDVSLKEVKTDFLNREIIVFLSRCGS